MNEAKERTTSTQFLRWVAYFEREWNHATPEIWHLAQIAHLLYLILHMFGGTPTKTVQDFVMSGKFSTEKPPEDETPEQMQERIKQSRDAWVASLTAGMVAANRKAEREAKRKGKPSVGKKLERRKGKKK